MANYPNSIYSPRVVTDKSGVVYNAAKTTIVFAKDKNDPDAEIAAIETELGTLPKNTSASVKERLKGIRSLSDANADIIIVKASNVGIGTTNPGANLHVVGTGAHKTFVDNYSTTNGYVPDLQFRLSNSNTIGTLAGTVSGNYLSEIGFWGVDSSNTAFREAAYIDVLQDGAAGATWVPGRFQFTTTRASDGVAVTGLTIKNDGNVGIGTTGPGAKLDIREANAAADYTTLQMGIPGTGGVAGSQTIRFGMYGANYGSAIKTEYNYAGNTYTNLKFQTSWSDGLQDRVTILGSGNVGIGTTGPTSKLQVVGLPIYANNAAAVAGGLTAGAFYRTNADPDPVCVVH